jgi:hypothetical protein
MVRSRRLSATDSAPVVRSRPNPNSQLAERRKNYLY